MKIAMVFDGLGTGGIERVGMDYVKLLQKLGHEVTIYNLKPNQNEMEKMYPENCKIIRKSLSDFLLPDRYMLIVKRWRWGKYLYPFLYLGTWILMYLYRLTMGRRQNYDVAVAFSGHFRDLTFVSANYIKSKKKLCWLHGALMEYLVSSCTYGDQYRRIKNLCVLSEANQASALSMNHYLYGLNIQHIYNPIDLEQMNVNERHVKELQEQYGEFLLMVGRFEKDKDQDTVIRALKLLKDKNDRKEKLVLVGGGSRLEECKALAGKLGLAEQVVFTGTRHDVGDFYRAAKLFVHSSPAEGLPTVLLEAMKYGVPIVATRSMPGVEEILKGDKYGLQCEVENPQDMAEKIERCLNDGKIRDHYIAKGRERVQDFSYSQIEGRLQRILENLV